MRILDSQLAGYVSHSSQQSESEQELTQTHLRQRGLEDGQQIVMRQESIDLSGSEYFESEKSSRLYSKSTIVDSDASKQTTITQEELASSLASGVLEREVNIGNMVFENARSSDLSFGANLGLSFEMGSAIETGSTIESGLSVDASSEALATQTEVSVVKQNVMERDDSLTLVSEGEVTTSDGRAINYRLELDLDQRYFQRTEQTLSVRSEDLVDPLVISLDGRAPTLTNSTFIFDINSDGEVDKLSSLSSGAGFLAFDRNKDGVINDGQELFGPQSGNGYEDLAVFDENGDGWIDESDAIFSQLVVWLPGESGEEGELISLKDAEVGAISLEALESPFTITDEQNNTLGVVQRSGVYLKENGQAGLVQQIDLVVQLDKDETSLSKIEFDARAEELERVLQQHLAEHQDGFFLSRAIEVDPSVVEIQTSLDVVDLNAPPITVIARQFQLMESAQEQFSQQQSSFTEVVVEPVAAKQESVEEQITEVIADSMSNVSVFSGVRRSDSDQLAIDVREDKHSVLSGIIDDVLRPLQEQLRLKRERASGVYKGDVRA